MGIHGAFSVIGSAVSDLASLSRSGAWDFDSGLWHPALDALNREVASYRVAWIGVMNLVPLASPGVGLQEAMVRFAIARCREAGVSETEIAAVLGEYADLARDDWAGLAETTVRRRLPWQMHLPFPGYD